MQATTLEITLIITHTTPFIITVHHSESRRTHANTDCIKFVRIYEPTLSHNKRNHGPSLITTHKFTVSGALTSTHGEMHV
jgi:hypothetical protein